VFPLDVGSLEDSAVAVGLELAQFQLVQRRFSESPWLPRGCGAAAIISGTVPRCLWAMSDAHRRVVLLTCWPPAPDAR